MYEYHVEFDNKKEKSAFLNTLEFFNNMTKNIYNSIIFDYDGNVFSTDMKLEGCKCLCETSGLKDLFNLNKGDLIQLICQNVYECIKNGKTKIESMTVKYNEIYINTTDGEYQIGNYIISDELNIDKLMEIRANRGICSNCNDLIDLFKEKKFIDYDIHGYRMFLTHKLFSNLTKINNINIQIVPTDKTFYSIFEFTHEYKDKYIKIYYFYHFVKL